MKDNHYRESKEKGEKDIKDLEVVKGFGSKEMGGVVLVGGRKVESQFRLEGEIFWEQWEGKCEEERKKNSLLEDGEGAVSLEMEIEEIAKLEKKSELDDECWENND